MSALRAGVAVKGRRAWFSLDPAGEKFFQEIRKKFNRPPLEPKSEPSAEAVREEPLHQAWLGEQARGPLTSRGAG